MGSGATMLPAVKGSSGVVLLVASSLSEQGQYQSPTGLPCHTPRIGQPYLALLQAPPCPKERSSGLIRHIWDCSVVLYPPRELSWSLRGHICCTVLPTTLASCPTSSLQFEGTDWL